MQTTHIKKSDTDTHYIKNKLQTHVFKKKKRQSTTVEEDNHKNKRMKPENQREPRENRK